MKKLWKLFNIKGRKFDWIFRKAKKKRNFTFLFISYMTWILWEFLSSFLSPWTHSTWDFSLHQKLTFLWPNYFGFDIKKIANLSATSLLHPLSIPLFIYPQIYPSSSWSHSFLASLLNKFVSSFVWFIARFFFISSVIASFHPPIYVPSYLSFFPK